MRAWRRYGRGWVIALTMVWTLAPTGAEAALDSEEIAQRIADSLINLRGKGSKYKTIAFSQIRAVGATDLDLDEVIDYTTTKILQTVLELDVVNRGQLQRILREQQFQLSDIVSADEYKELGQLAGVDLFIYGNLYSDALILKAIDVQSSVIAWAELIPLGEEGGAGASFVDELGKQIVASMKDNPRLKRANIKTLSFWDFRSTTDLSEEEIIDYLTVYITRDGTFKVVDRNNLKLILGEQTLNQAVYFDEDSAAELGGLYGVQAFFNGTIKQSGGQIVADMKMTDIHTGKFVWAAILRFDEDGGGGTAARAAAAGAKGGLPPGMVFVASGVSIQGTNSTPAEARPAHQVKLPAFVIDVTELSNRKYLEFVTKRKHRLPVGWNNDRFPRGAADLPVTGVTWDDARDYCRFVGKRLPSEAEWEKSARGNAGQPYPWQGDNFVSGFSVTRESGKKGSVAVHAAGKDISPYRVKHMAGNVREWVNDVFRKYPGSNAANRKFNKERVVRGSSWAQNARAATTYFRGSSGRNLAWPDVGFRCAQSANVAVPRR